MKIKKITLTKVKKAIFLATAIIIILLSFFFVYKILTPITEENQVTLYDYTMNVGSNYKVHLKENGGIYDTLVMEENMIYPKSIFDKLSLDLYAEFLGSSNTKSQIIANYSIGVVVRGFQKIGEEKKIVYEKTFPIEKKSNIFFSDNASIKKNILFDFSQYESYVTNVETLIKAEPSKEAILIFSGNFMADTDFGQKEEEYVYSMNLPVNTDLFTINKLAPIEKTGSITKTEVSEVVSDKTLLIIPILLILFMLILIIYILKFTLPPTKEEILRMRFKSIMRKHGSRIVRVNRSINSLYETVMEIKDMEGMIKISDEYNIPIFFMPADNGMPEDNKMFIPGKDICYVYYIDSDISYPYYHLGSN